MMLQCTHVSCKPSFLVATLILNYLYWVVLVLREILSVYIEVL